MKITLLIIGIIVGLVMIVTVIGYFLPQNHVASRTAELKTSPHEIWKSISETVSDGDITYEIVESVPPAKLVTRIANKDLPYGGTWTYRIDPIASGSRLTITENGEIYNPFFRFMSRFLLGHHSTMDRYLKSLAGKFGEDITIAGR